MYENIVSRRVYFGETDAGGVVYFGNYSKYIEIGFSEWFREFAKPLVSFHSDNDIFMVVKKNEQNYINSLKYDDLICIHTKMIKIKNFSVTFQTEIYVDNVLYYSAITSLVPINYKTGSICMLPKDVIDKVKDYI